MTNRRRDTCDAANIYPMKSVREIRKKYIKTYTQGSDDASERKCIMFPFYLFIEKIFCKYGGPGRVTGIRRNGG